MKLTLPHRANLVKTNDEDPIDFYYYPLIGLVYKKRLINTLSLLERRSERLLDIGYGSGLLFPELLARASEVCGLETHGRESQVYEMIDKEKIDRSRVILKPGSILAMPWPDGYFDAVVSVSTLEHIEDLDKAMSEIRRVLKPGGQAVLSFPIRNRLTDYFYRLFGFNPRQIHPSSDQDIIAAAGRFFKIERTLELPKLYCSIRCIKA